ncbi:MAG: hypothetical protein NTY70_05555, partial [Burkholderiales bacterium]|nr:hypothetical protein [Burkholderiales bacterium]
GEARKGSSRRSTTGQQSHINERSKNTTRPQQTKNTGQQSHNYKRSKNTAWPQQTKNTRKPKAPASHCAYSMRLLARYWSGRRMEYACSIFKIHCSEQSASYQRLFLIR